MDENSLLSRVLRQQWKPGPAAPGEYRLLRRIGAPP